MTTARSIDVSFACSLQLELTTFREYSEHPIEAYCLYHNLLLSWYICKSMQRNSDPFHFLYLIIHQEQTTETHLIALK